MRDNKIPISMVETPIVPCPALATLGTSEADLGRHRLQLSRRQQSPPPLPLSDSSGTVEQVTAYDFPSAVHVDLAGV